VYPASDLALFSSSLFSSNAVLASFLALSNSSDNERISSLNFDISTSAFLFADSDCAARSCSSTRRFFNFLISESIRDFEAESLCILFCNSAVFLFYISIFRFFRSSRFFQFFDSIINRIK